MDSLRIDIAYRPLRIGWAIRAGDFDAFRRAVRYSYALWGGPFNPILIVDREEEANHLIDLFRVDVILPIGESDEVKNFPNNYPYLTNPFFHNDIFMKGGEDTPPYAQVLDIYNLLTHLQDNLEWKWKAIKDKGVRIYKWQPDDVLANVLLVQQGGYPSKDEVGTDYASSLLEVSKGRQFELEPTTPIPRDIFEYPSISDFSRYGLMPHYSVPSGRGGPGFFVGNAENFDDLVCYWNLRASDIDLWFIDFQHIKRCEGVIAAREKQVREMVDNYRFEYDRVVTIWTHREDSSNARSLFDEARRFFGDKKLSLHNVSGAIWNEGEVCPPMMYLGETSALGIVGGIGGKVQVSFSLSEKPFCDNAWYYRQHLVASISMIGKLYDDEQQSFSVPYIPELNEFYARTMHFDHSKIRVEPERIGLIVAVTNNDKVLLSLPVSELMERVFDLAGYSVDVSSAGLITRQLIAQLGSIQGAAVFKVPGVRQLLKTFGPNKSFTKNAALQKIGSGDPDRTEARFKNYENLYIETRDYGHKLTPNAIFGYLVEKRLFRIGVKLVCPTCRMETWTSLDSLKQQLVCDLCGHKYDATRQLVDSNEWHYRRSGVLGQEKNALGAIPVVLTLQQIESNLYSTGQDMYSPSLELSVIKEKKNFVCEVDFVWVRPRDYPRKTEIILGECKDSGEISAQNIKNMKVIADSLPRKRFKVFLCCLSLCLFQRRRFRTQEHSTIHIVSV